MEVERLSLENFEPSRSHAPYLNTPRSLEACRRHGVEPIELAEVPIDEFRKSFPNDPDTANRRYARLDGARQRILKNVQHEWQMLCENGWKPETKATRIPVAEQIIPVPPEIHCELLEIQAHQFRRLEQKQMSLFKRMLKIELKQAVEHVQHRRIMEKHAAIQEALDTTEKERNLAREILHHEKLMEERRREANELKEMRMDKKSAQLESIRMHDDKVKNDEREKQNRVARDMSLLQNQEYIRNKRQFIMDRVDMSIEQKRLVKEQRDAEQAARIQQANEYKERQNQLKKEELQQKVLRAQQDKEKFETEKREEMEKRVREHEEKRDKIKRDQQAKFEASLGNSTADSQDKMNRIRQQNEDILNEKTQKIVADMQFKEYLTNKELNRVKEQQERRQTIKAIREESFQLASLRKHKIDEFERNKAEAALKQKEDRIEAIRAGAQALKQMRFDVKNIMFQTKLELKRELARLQHKDEYDPDQVYEKAVEVTETVLLPALDRKFTVAEYDRGRSDATGNTKQSPFLSSVLSDSSQNQLGGLQMTRSDKLSKSAGDMSSVLQGTRASPSPPKTSHSLTRASTASSIGNPLPLRGLKKDALLNTLEFSKVFGKIPPEHDERRGSSKSKSPQRAMTASLSGPTGDVNERSRSVKSSKAKSQHSQQKSSTQQLRDSVQPLEAEDDAQSVDDMFPLYNYSLMDSDGDSGVFDQGGRKSRGRSRGTKSGKKSQKHLPNPKPVMNGPGDNIRTIQTEVASVGEGSARQDAQNSIQSRSSSAPTSSTLPISLRAPGPGEYRREFSTDHPLAGGKGMYKKEKSQGHKLVGAGQKTSEKSSEIDRIERLSYAAQVMVVDPEKQLEKLRKEQNDALLHVLDQERKAEEAREGALKQLEIDSAHALNPEVADRERSKLELMFMEERKRASERIIALTKEHETNIKDAVVQMMALGSAKK